MSDARNKREPTLLGVGMNQDEFDEEEATSAGMEIPEHRPGPHHPVASPQPTPAPRPAGTRPVVPRPSGTPTASGFPSPARSLGVTKPVTAPKPGARQSRSPFAAPSRSLGAVPKKNPEETRSRQSVEPPFAAPPKSSPPPPKSSPPPPKLSSPPPGRELPPVATARIDASHPSHPAYRGAPSAESLELNSGELHSLEMESLDSALLQSDSLELTSDEIAGEATQVAAESVLPPSPASAPPPPPGGAPLATGPASVGVYPPHGAQALNDPSVELPQLATAPAIGGAGRDSARPTRPAVNAELVSSEELTRPASIEGYPSFEAAEPAAKSNLPIILAAAGGAFVLFLLVVGLVVAILTSDDDALAKGEMGPLASAPTSASTESGSTPSALAADTEGSGASDGSSNRPSRSADNGSESGGSATAAQAEAEAPADDEADEGDDEADEVAAAQEADEGDEAEGDEGGEGGDEAPAAIAPGETVPVATMRGFELEMPRASRRIRRMSRRRRGRLSRRLRGQAQRAYRNRDYERAERLFRRAIEANPADGVAAGGLARSLARQNELPEALAWAERFKERASRNAAAYRILGDVWRQAGHDDRARRVYRAGLRRRPRDRWLRERIRELRR